jgi:multidrug efflux pump subunit AcrA (membrane-fusion protein)
MRAYAAPLLLRPALNPVVLIIILITLLALAFGMVILRYSITVALHGKLVSVPGVVNILSPIDASLLECWVRNGTYVKAGERLCKAIGAPSAVTRSGRLTRQELAKNAEEQLALANGESELQQRQAKLRSNRITAQLSAYRAQAQLIRDKLSIQEYRERISSGSLQLARELQKSGFVSDEWLAARELQHLAIVGDAVDLRVAAESISEKTRDRVYEKSEQMLSAQLQLAEQAAKIGKLKSSLLTLTSEDEQYVTTAQTGIVSKTSPSLSAARRGDLIMTILPERATFEAHLRASNQDRGSIKVGDEVDISYSMDVQYGYGKTYGVVSQISSIPSTDSINTRDPYYDVVVSLKEQAIVKEGRRYSLFEGMELTGWVLVRRSTIFNRLKDSILGQ